MWPQKKKKKVYFLQARFEIVSSRHWQKRSIQKAFYETLRLRDLKFHLKSRPYKYINLSPLTPFEYKYIYLNVIKQNMH